MVFVCNAKGNLGQREILGFLSERKLGKGALNLTDNLKGTYLTLVNPRDMDIHVEQPGQRT